MEDREDRLGSGISSQLEKAEGKPLLASVDTVTELLRQFFSDAITRRAKYLAGEIAPQEAMQGDTDAAKELSALLNGSGPRVEDYFVQPWNSPEQMGQFLKDTYDFDCLPEEAAFCVIMGGLTEVYGTVDHIADSNLDPEDSGWMIDGIIENYANALLGIQLDDDED